jgi:hypothetical protein
MMDRAAHWHGLEIGPDGVAGPAELATHHAAIQQPTFAPSYTTAQRNVLHHLTCEMRQMAPACTGRPGPPRDTTRDHVIVAGGGGLPMFYKQAPNFLLVNGDASPKAIHMTVGDTNRIRIVSIHADEVLGFRFGTPEKAVNWKPLARAGADLPTVSGATATPAVAQWARRDRRFHVRSDAAWTPVARGVDSGRTTRCSPRPD